MSQKRLWKWDWKSKSIVSVKVLRETDKMFFIERVDTFNFAAKIEKRHFEMYSLSPEEAIRKALERLKEDDDLFRIGLADNESNRTTLMRLLRCEVKQKARRR